MKGKLKAKERRPSRKQAEPVHVDVKGKGKAHDSSVEEMDEEDDTAAVEEETDCGLEQDNDAAWKAEAYVTGVNYHVKKMVFLLFINSTSALSLTSNCSSHCNRSSRGVTAYQTSH
jgi:hypothetical protein